MYPDMGTRTALVPNESWPLRMESGTFRETCAGDAEVS